MVADLRKQTTKERQDDKVPPAVAAWRRYFVLLLLGVAFVGLFGRAVHLQLRSSEFLKKEGNSRHLRVVNVPAHRGSIVDRHGEPLAVTTPVDSVWVAPVKLLKFEHVEEAVARLAQELGLRPTALMRDLQQRSQREFWYLRRKVDPELAARVRQLHIPGVHFQREYQRFYPDGEVTAQLIGVTDVDDRGQEGIELAYDHWLNGQAGRKRVVRDRDGAVVQDVENIEEPQPGKALQLTIDRRIQYLAYRELKSAVVRHNAKGGTVVVLDPISGELLALASQPGFNPNNRSDFDTSRMRNRVMTDQFEPGSTVKPFTVAAALENRVISPNVVLDTTPGVMRLGKHQVRDIRNYGVITLVDLIKKSSNVGATQLALKMDPNDFVDTLAQLGFGSPSGIGLPGETAGVLSARQHWSEIERATFSFGYGFSVSALQLAQAYAVLANAGVKQPLTLIKGQNTSPPTQVFSPATISELTKIMEGGTEPDGGGAAARIPNFRVAGKSGTVRKLGDEGYSQDRYHALFAGFAPASTPKLVVVVMIDEPSKGKYYGGAVAAPVFSAVMEGALRFLNVAPDDLPAEQFFENAQQRGNSV